MDRNMYLHVNVRITTVNGGVVCERSNDSFMSCVR